MIDGNKLVENLRGEDGGLSREAIKKLIPYGDAFLFVDRITTLTEKTVEAEYAIPRQLPFLEAHFVDFPIMPGALISEGCAQAGTVLVRSRLEDPQAYDLVVGRVEDARYFQPAFPGDTLNYKVELLALGSHAARLSGQTRRGEEKIASFRVVVAILRKEKLRSRN